MENKINIFQMVLLCIFGALAVLGVVFFTTIRSTDSQTTTSPVVIWGTFQKGQIDSVLNELKKSNPVLARTTYTQIDARTFYTVFTEALASGTGPDLVIVDHASLLAQNKKFEVLSFEQYPERRFNESFVEAGSIFTTPTGILGIPFVLDPLVLYWNTEQFSAAGLAIPPRYWQEMYDLVPKLAVIDNDFTVTKAAIPLGEYSNVTNAKAILSALFLQAGSPLIHWDNGSIKATFTDASAMAAVRFYVEFSNPTRAAYNWNRSLRSSRDMFLSGNLAMYPGFASEYELLQESNPNLPFDISILPQAKTASKRITFANVYGFAVPKASRNKSGAWAVAAQLTNTASAKAFSEALNLAPIRRDVASTQKPRAIDSILSESAIISKAWLEPTPESTDRIFSRMIDSITSGRSTVESAIFEAGKEFSETIE